MGHCVKSSCVLGALLVSSCCVLAFLATEDQPQASTGVNSTDVDEKLLFSEDFLVEGCKMEFHEVKSINIGEKESYDPVLGFYKDERKTYIREKGVFYPVINLLSNSSITVHSQSNISFSLNLTNLPVGRPLSARFDILAETFQMQLPSLVSVNLSVEGISDITRWPRLIGMTFKSVDMTNYNCTNGQPFYEDHNVSLVADARMELLLLLTEKGKDSAIAGAINGENSFYICSDGGRPFIGKGQPSCVFSSRISHLLTLRHDSQTNETKLNDTRFHNSNGSVSFTGGDYFLITCLNGCPTMGELLIPQGNPTKKGDKTCVYDMDIPQLVVIFCILILSLIAIDVGAMVVNCVSETLLWYHRLGRRIHRPVVKHSPPDYKPEYLILS